MYSGSAKEGLPALLAIGVAVEDWDRRVSRRGVGGPRWQDLVSQECEAVILRYESTSFFGARDGCGLAHSGEGGGIDLLDVDVCLAVVEVGEIRRLAVWRDSEGRPAMMRVATAGLILVIFFYHGRILHTSNTHP